MGQDAPPKAFDLRPVLEGDLVRLRPLAAEDFPVLYAVASDPLIWEQHPARDRHQKEVFREFFREALESRGAFAVLDAKTGEMIGSTRFHGYDSEKSEIEIGWTFLARSRWGGAHNREMKRLLLRHAFRFVERVVFLVGPDNRRSRRAVEKIGGALAGTRTDKTGRVSVVYEITREAYICGPLESAGSTDPISLKPIGRVESPLTDRASAPKQGDEGAPEAWLVFAAGVLEALRGLEPGMEVLLLTWLDRARRDVLSVHPRGDLSRQQSGVFATRSPDRPNPIGLHRITIAEIDGPRFRVRNLEVLDGTPILDIKPVLGPAAER
jgi:tRNA-Thr(GGU) m(6)t(6)A37 methyltransferase TsaA